jgi:putative flavoprotein involved in K+ transport
MNASRSRERHVDDLTSATAQAADWLSNLDRALRSRDIDAATALFGDECYWRDLVTFTWNIKTMEGRDEIAQMLKANLEAIAPSNWRPEDDAALVDGAIESSFTFETAVARGRGHLRLRDGKAWTLLTAMVELKGHEEKKGPARIQGVEHGARDKQKNWLERKREEEEALGFTKQPYCIIVGGGQGGIALGARMKRLGVPTIIVEKNDRPGDSWRKRYKSLVLHDPVWYDHLPYLPFPDDWPIFTPKDKIGDWLEMYVKVMELNYWASSECVHASFD